MQRETASTTATPEYVIDTIAHDVDSIAEITPADVRGNVEIDASFTSFNFIKDLGEAPAYANQHIDKAFLAEVGSRALIPMAAMPGEKPVVESTQETPASRTPGETIDRSRDESRVTRVKNALGRIASAPLRTARSAKDLYYSGMVTAVAALPGTKSKEEIREQVHTQREKYADKPGDGFFARKWNAVRRKKYEMLAWTPVAAMGLAAIELYALRTAGYFHVADSLPVQPQTRDWHNAIVVNPLPLVETHDVVSSQVAAVIDTPAPKPAYTKHVWTPIHDAAPAPSTVEKPAFTGKEIVIVTGGATDPTGDLATQQLIDNGTIDPNKVTIIKNQYPAEMAPFVGQQTTQQSTAIGAQNIRDIIAQNPNARITSYAFSEGNFPNDTVGAEQYRLGNKDVNFVGYGSGNAASGLLNSPLAEAFRPIVDGFGITRTPPAPGSTMILDGSDGYASNAGGDIGKLLNNAMGPGHRIVGPNEPRLMTFDVNGVHYEVVGNTIPLPPNAILTSGIPAPGFGGLPELRPADLTPAGQAPLPGPEPAPVGQLLPPAPGPEPVRSATPSFFGEQPCVAPDGSQYFTPANASC